MSEREMGPKPPRSRIPLALILALAGLLIVAAGVVALTSGGGAAGTGAATSPEIVVDRQEVDFGAVPVNQRVKAEFKLTNAGGKPLQIVGEPQVEVVKGC